MKIILSIVLMLLAQFSAPALILTGQGNDPVRDAGWPDGALAVANLKSRVSWWEGPPFGGGEWQFLYRGDTTKFQEALAAFAAIRAPAVELVIHDGPLNRPFGRRDEKSGDDGRADWTFTVWVPANWHRLFNNPKSTFGADQPQFRQPVAPPRLDVYIGGGSVDWAAVKVPAHVRVTDERASAAGVQPVGGGLVRVDAYDLTTGKAIRGAHLVIAGADAENRGSYKVLAEARGDATGHLEVGKIPAGTHRVIVEAEGYAPRMLGYVNCETTPFKQFTTELVGLASIHGRVTDSAGQPVKNVKVQPSNVMALDGRGYNQLAGAEARTDDSGFFTLTNLPTGFTQFHIYEEGYYFGDLFTIHEVPGTNVALRLTKAGLVQVTITDPAGKALSRFEGKPLYVNIEPVGGSKPGSWGGGGTVKDDGTLEFKGMPPGEYRLTSRPNPATSNRTYTPAKVINVTPGEPVKVTMVYE